MPELDTVHDQGSPPSHHDDVGVGKPAADPLVSEIIAEFSGLFIAARTSWSRYAEEIHPDLSGGGMTVLQFIVRRGAVTATGISQAMDMDKALVSRQIAKLREFGLVDAELSPEDRRVQLLTPTPKATELTEQLRLRWAHSYQERFVDWTLEELEHFLSALHRFNASAELSVDGPTKEQG